MNTLREEDSVVGALPGGSQMSLRGRQGLDLWGLPQPSASTPLCPQPPDM